MKENIPPLSEWSAVRLHGFYEACGKSFRSCGRSLGCSPNTFKKYYNLAMNKKNDIEEVSDVVKATTKKPTKSASSSVFLNEMNVCLVDIEATGLRGDFGMILCAVVKPLGDDDTRYIFKLDFSNPDLLDAEKDMLMEIRDCIMLFDGIIGYYSSKYDLPMLRTRMLYHGIEPIPKIKHLDLYFTVKRVVNTTSRRMERVGDLLRVNSSRMLPEKTKLDINYWIRVAFSHDEKALGYIVDHCISDVDLLEGILHELRDFVPDRILRN